MTGLGTVSFQTPRSACLLVIVIQVVVQETAELQHIEAVSVRGVTSVPVCRRAVHRRKISSPKLDRQFLH